MGRPAAEDWHGQPFESLAARLIEVDNMQPSSGPLEVEDTGERDLQRSMLGIHLDTVAEEIANAAKLPQSDPSRIDRLMQLSRRQQALQRAAAHTA